MATVEDIKNNQPSIMHYKTFRILKMITAFVFAFMIAVSVVMDNFILAIIAGVALVAISFTLNRKVKGILSDERDRANAGNAARMAINVFSLAGAVMGLVLMFMHYEVVGSLLSYFVCALMLLYSAIFAYYEKQN